MNDETLIGLIAVGDKAATIEFYNRWFPQFTQLATKLTGDSHAGEDLAQEAVVRVLKKAGTYQPGRPREGGCLPSCTTGRDWARREGCGGP